MEKEQSDKIIQLSVKDLKKKPNTFDRVFEGVVYYYLAKCHATSTTEEANHIINEVRKIVMNNDSNSS